MFEEPDDGPELDIGPDLDVLFINRGQRIAVLTDNSVIPVTHWFDHMARECDPLLAVSCVAGCDEVGWFSIDLEAFSYATVH